MPRQKSTHVDDPKAVGERLRTAREAAGLSQRQLSFTGCSPAYISRIEAGDRIPSLQLLRELGRRLGVTEDFLATGSEVRPQAINLLEAEIALRLDDLERARELYTQSLENARTPSERAQAGEGLGHLALRLGDARQAVALFEQALVDSRMEEWQVPTLAESLARAYSVVGELEPSVAILERCLAAFEQIGDRVQAIRFACVLGYALSDAGQFARAEQVVSKALAEGRDSFDPYMRARVYWARAKLQLDQGDFDGASRYAYQALAALELTEDLHYTGLAHQLVARIELERGEAQEALSHLAQGWPLVERTGTPIEQAQFRLEEARALAQTGEREQATAIAMDVLGLLGDAEPLEGGRLYALLAEVALDLGDEDEALELYEKAAALLESATGNRALVDVYAKVGELYERQGRTDEAYASMKKAVSTQQTLSVPRR